MPLIDPRRFREIVSGQRLTLGAAIYRALAAAAEPLVRWGVAWRNRRYDAGHAKVASVRAPVISVGNLTLGGTGKTPCVAWVAQQVRESGRGVTLISRGYGRRGNVPNDEARELALRMPDVPHLQNPDRVAAAQKALTEHPDHALVLDDAFQHRRLARDLDIVLLDALEPFGFERLFPRGTLREPPEALARAQAVVLTRADLITPAERQELRARVLGLAPDVVWAEARYHPQHLRNANGVTRPISELNGGPVAAFCGIGNPAGFEHTLASAGLRVLDLFAFADHQAYSPADLARLAAWVEKHGAAKAVVCTLKDLVKIDLVELAGRPLWALQADLEFLAGESELKELLLTRLRKI